MYVCVCRAVTDGAIDKAVQQGCCSMRDLRTELGGGNPMRPLCADGQRSVECFTGSAG